jgi:hypothetical protein
MKGARASAAQRGPVVGVAQGVPVVAVTAPLSGNLDALMHVKAEVGILMTSTGSPLKRSNNWRDAVAIGAHAVVRHRITTHDGRLEILLPPWHQD